MTKAAKQSPAPKQEAAVKGKKVELHPKANLLKVIFPNGDTLETYSTYSKSDIFHADRSITEHPAWNPSKTVVANAAAENIRKFMDKFGAFGSFGSPSKVEDKEN